MSQLFETKQEAVWSLQIPEKISKRQHSIASSSAQLQVLPFTSSWLIWTNTISRADERSYLRCSWKSKQLRTEKGKLFLQMMSLLSSSFSVAVVLCGEGKKPKESICFAASQMMTMLEFPHSQPQMWVMWVEPCARFCSSGPSLSSQQCQSPGSVAAWAQQRPLSLPLTSAQTGALYLGNSLYLGQPLTQEMPAGICIITTYSAT